MTLRMLEQEIDRTTALQRQLDEAAELLRDIVSRGLLPAYTDGKVRSFLIRLGGDANE